MQPSSAVAPLREISPESPSEDAITAEQFVSAAAAGLTIALVVAKEPEAAAVYYFRDGLRAFATYERLGKLGSPPFIVTLSSDGRVLGHLAQQVQSSLRRHGLSWLPGFAYKDGGSRTTAAVEGATLARESPRRREPPVLLPAT
jgi:hypothetical protein